MKRKLTIGISTRALFDLKKEHELYSKEGIEAFLEHQIRNEDEILMPGPGFNLVEKLLNISNKEFSIEVVLVSRNSSESGIRIFNSIENYGLKIERACFTNGGSTHPYLQAFEIDLYLSSNPEEVEKALKAGDAAATIFNTKRKTRYRDQLRLAFDGDAVLFSDESEAIYQKDGLEAFENNERLYEKIAMKDGPFRKFLDAIQGIQSSFPVNDNPIRTALVTARSTNAAKRVIHTMREWGIRIDESFFLGGLDKGIFLKEFDADIFFDDHTKHCNSACKYVPTGHVPNNQ